MRMTDSLTPEQCDKVRHFLGALVAARHKGTIDVAQFMVNYRNEYGSNIVHTKSMTDDEKERRRNRRREALPYLVEHRHEPASMLAAHFGVTVATIGRWYKAAGIVRQHSRWGVINEKQVQ